LRHYRRFERPRKGKYSMMPPKLILVPIDFSASSQEALEVATDMASRLGSALLLVHIVPAIPDLPKDVSIFKEGEYDSELHQIASKQLSDLATTLKDKNLNVRAEVGTANDVGMELVRIAEHDNVDMIGDPEKVRSYFCQSGWSHN
jgi:nucleotide-binding universal stress UspA family protein